MEEDGLVQIRMRFVEDLEDILQCPVCWEIPTGSILTCLKGHHICEICRNKTQLVTCPSCESQFTGSRNYLAEDLSAKFEDIKTSLVNPNHYINRKLLKNRKSIHTQTCIQVESKATQIEVNQVSASSQTSTETSSTETQTDLREIGVGTTLVKEDLGFNVQEQICFIGNCNSKYSINETLIHMKKKHKENLTEIAKSENGLASTMWTVSCKTSQSFGYILNILDMGLFFLNILIDDSGDLFAGVQIAKNYCTDKQEFYFILLINNVHNGLLSEVFKGKVPTFNNKNESLEHDAFISNASLNRYILKDNQAFECALSLYKPDS